MMTGSTNDYGRSINQIWVKKKYRSSSDAGAQCLLILMSEPQSPISLTTNPNRRPFSKYSTQDLDFI